jgi:hypothetical protein
MAIKNFIEYPIFIKNKLIISIKFNGVNKYKNILSLSFIKKMKLIKKNHY